MLFDSLRVVWYTGEPREDRWLSQRWPLEWVSADGKMR
jgi:hypothetical protein